jgi:hypothetical protein
MYESARWEALEKREPASWASERVRQYGMAGLFPDFQHDFPFILYRQSVPRPAWSGKRDFHQDKLHQVYELLLALDREIEGPVGDVGKRFVHATERALEAITAHS